ncbi:MAG: hypothetical protein U9R79_01165 [Armatimonadota bacterium]|nr:hypothetical protein [Armatimonadota bacterium]
MSRRTLGLDILWTVLAVGVMLAGIIACARVQGTVQTAGLRVALIMMAIFMGIAGGLLAERIRRRTRRRRPRHAPRRHRVLRKIAFAAGGVVVSATIVVLCLTPEAWLVVVIGLVSLCAVWLWYAFETRGLSRGPLIRWPRRRRRKSDSSEDDATSDSES